MAVEKAQQPRFWYSNAIFFVGTHLLALAGIYSFPPWRVRALTLALCFFTWMVAMLGITIGYHRLFSHRSFNATFVVRLALALCGSLGFQGSIKWWVLRHRLHHRYTDDLVHDPYAATRGLFFSHMGWIFYKPTYERMKFIDKEDLDEDPVVRFQHQYYVPIAIFLGFIVPVYIGHTWGDPKGALVWAGLVARVFIWHCTFLVNSLAHWDGLQPYSDENTSRGELLVALLTFGEGNHNFHHAFPHDYRSGPSMSTWDPSKWIIMLLYKVGLVTLLRRAREEDIQDALAHMQATGHAHGHSHADESWDGPTWSREEVLDQSRSKSLVLVDSFIVDVSEYKKEHPGGEKIIGKYIISNRSKAFPDATWAFHGGMNSHSRSAKKRMRELTVCRLRDD